MRANIIKSGTRFGKLTIVEWNKDRKEYLCKCDCGEKTYARSWSLKTGRHKSCRCGLTGERLERRLPDNLALKNNLFYSYKKRAENKKLPFQLSFDEFTCLIQKNCFYCGLEPQQRGLKRELRNRTFKYNGIDRIDNNTGYLKQNCVPCCEQCNNSKKTLSLKEWMEWIKRLTDYQSNRENT